MIKPYRRHSAECEYGALASDGQRHGGLRDKLAAGKRKLTKKEIDREVRGWKHCRCAVWCSGSWAIASRPQSSPPGSSTTSCTYGTWATWAACPLTTKSPPLRNWPRFSKGGHEPAKH